MGKIFKFHTDVDTDQIIASQYLLFPTIDEMKAYTFESLDPDFAKNVQPGDFVVACENFGCGSSREQAPSVLKALGVKAVIAKSFARIFYRNAINIGLAILECPAAVDRIEAGHELEADMDAGVILDKTTGEQFKTAPFPPFIQKMIENGGLMESIKKGEFC
jgi:3-isopropylmalate dehydratase small subunit